VLEYRHGLRMRSRTQRPTGKLEQTPSGLGEATEATILAIIAADSNCENIIDRFESLLMGVRTHDGNQLGPINRLGLRSRRNQL
jgi:hypothetical protein